MCNSTLDPGGYVLVAEAFIAENSGSVLPNRRYPLGDRVGEIVPRGRRVDVVLLTNHVGAVTKVIEDFYQKNLLGLLASDV